MSPVVGLTMQLMKAGGVLSSVTQSEISPKCWGLLPDVEVGEAGVTSSQTLLASEMRACRVLREQKDSYLQRAHNSVCSDGGTREAPGRQRLSGSACGVQRARGWAGEQQKAFRANAWVTPA